MKRGIPFPFFVLLPLKPAREKSKVPEMQSLPGICVSFLPDLCRVRVHPWAGARGGAGASETLGCGCSAAASGKGASEGHVRVSPAPGPARQFLCGPVLWNCTRLLPTWFCSQGARGQCLSVQLSCQQPQRIPSGIGPCHSLLSETWFPPSVCRLPLLIFPTPLLTGFYLI